MAAWWKLQSPAPEVCYSNPRSVRLYATTANPTLKAWGRPTKAGTALGLPPKVENFSLIPPISRSCVCEARGRCPPQMSRSSASMALGSILEELRFPPPLCSSGISRRSASVSCGRTREARLASAARSSLPECWCKPAIFQHTMSQPNHLELSSRGILQYK